MKKLLIFITSIIVHASIWAQDTKEKLNTSLIGRFHYEAAAYSKDSLSNGTGFSDIRLGAVVEYGKWNGKVEIGFTNSTIGVKDVFAQYLFTDNSYIKAGHFPEPFGLDFMEGSSNIKFLTPSGTTQAFVPGRRLGVKYVYRNNFLWTAFGVFGDQDINNSVKGDDGYALTGRFVYNPIKKENYILHLGVAGSYRKADANGVDEEGYENGRIASFNSTAETNIDMLEVINAEVNNADNQSKFAAELIGAYGPVHFQGEYMYNNVNRTHTLPNYSAKGMYGQLGFLLIGGNYSYSPTVARLAVPNPGSLEFVVRYNITDLNCAKADIYGGKMNDFSFAVNYYINKYFAVRLNYTNVDLDNHAFNGKENYSMVQARIQLSF